LGIQAKEAIVVFYSTSSPQKCKYLNTEKQDAEGHLGSNVTPERENRNFRKKVITNRKKNHYADLEDTCSDKVTRVGVIVRCTKIFIEKKKQSLGSNLTPGDLLRVN
jgi:hypothetical protein